MARIIAMFTGSGSSAETRDPPQVIRGGGAMHGHRNADPPDRLEHAEYLLHRLGQRPARIVQAGNIVPVVTRVPQLTAAVLGCDLRPGDLLADGVRAAAARIGRGSEKYAYHSKGLELPGYDPRGAQGTALSFAVCNRGADYASVYPAQEFFWTPEQAQRALGNAQAVDPLSPAGKGALVRYASILSAVLDGLGICKVPVLSVLSKNWRNLFMSAGIPKRCVRLLAPAKWLTRAAPDELGLFKRSFFGAGCRRLTSTRIR